MRIAMTIGQLAVGGAEMQAVRLASALARRGHEVTIYTKGEVADAVRCAASEVAIETLFSFGGLRGVAKYGFGGALFARLVRDRPEIIHVHQLVEYHLLPSMAAAAWLGRPVIAKASGGGLAERNSDLLWLGRNPVWGRRLVRWAANHLDYAVAVSEEMSSELRESGFRVETIPNGVVLQPKREIAAPFDLVYVGRLHRVKGVDLLLDAWERIQDRIASSRLRLYGDGPERGTLEATVRRAGLARVEFRGEKEGPLEATPNAIFVLPSRAEGLSNALLEAMARGLPVVATAVGGTRDIIVDGANGLLVPPEDPAALATALVALLGDPARARALGTAARETVCGRYDLDQVAARYEALYHHLVSREQGARPCAVSRA